MDAVDGELVSAINSLVSGNFAGKSVDDRPSPVAANRARFRGFMKTGPFRAANWNGRDEGKILSF